MATPDTRASLIARLSDVGDELAWQEFLEIYQPMLVRLASRWGLQDADAREVVQETLLAVASAVSDFQRQPRRGAFRSWLSTITRNKLVDHLNRRQRQAIGSGDTDVHRWLDQQVSSESAVSIWQWHQRREVFRWASQQVQKQVSEKTWLAFHRTAVQCEPVETVANDLQMQPGMVYVARSRVMTRLRIAVQQWSSAQEAGEMNVGENEETQR